MQKKIAVNIEESLDITKLQSSEFTFDFEASFEQFVENITFQVRFGNLTKSEVEPDKVEPREAEPDDEEAINT